jgi:hypothetical protein
MDKNLDLFNQDKNPQKIGDASPFRAKYGNDLSIAPPDVFV